MARSSLTLDEVIGDHGKVVKYYRRLVLAQNYQLAGTLARDDFRYSYAKKYFREAQRLASEIQSPDLTATAVARHALVLLRQGEEHIKDALVMYQNAVDLAARAEPHVKAYVFSGLAETLARNGYTDECYRTLDQAQKLLDRAHTVPPEEDFTHVRLTLQFLEDTRGECYVLLGEPDKGLDYLRMAQRRLNPTMSRNRCRLLMQQSEAFLAAGYPDECVRYAIRGLQLAHAIESAGSINWASEIHSKLLQSKWKGEPVVGQLGAAIASYAQKRR